MSAHYFLAFHVPGTIGSYLHRIAVEIKEDCRYRYWTQPEDAHVTLVFLGALDRDRLSAVCRIVRPLAGRTDPFVVSLTHLGTFGQQTQPRVIFAGFSPSEPLGRFQAEAAALLAGQGIAADKRPYHPHVTLAKKWVAGDPLERRAPFESRSWTIDRLTLYRVEPKSRVRYRPVCVFPFRNVNSDKKVRPDSEAPVNEKGSNEGDANWLN